MIQKEFDAVKLMRELRDQLSQKYARMSIQEKMADLQKNLPPMKWQQRSSRKPLSRVGNRFIIAHHSAE